MKCQCGNEYRVCECGTAHFGGSSSAGHYIRCSLTECFDGGMYGPGDGQSFPTWECPADAGLCPACWHKENPGREWREGSWASALAQAVTRAQECYK